MKTEHDASKDFQPTRSDAMPEPALQQEKLVEPNREVRFAVVLYGGVSLAIYMNGISQELLRMVRGSSGVVDADLDPVERVYRELSLAMPDNAGGRTRFLVDIISGTSAGGINGVALAKALACGSRNLDGLRRAWTEKADIGLLLNDRGTIGRIGQRTESLLDGHHMYDVLFQTIRDMGEPTAQTDVLTPVLDLFVTATDLEGRVVPIQLTGTTVDERVHKAMFRFSYDSTNPEGSDFTRAGDAMLAFAARCTSSFPVAFPPMRVSDVPPQVNANAADFARHFPNLGSFDKRQFADGGYLDNRPFSYAIDLIPLRPTQLPGKRKLVFVDPFPELLADGDEPGETAAPNYDFLQNAKLGAATLPRREVIRDDLRAINRMNARLDRLGSLQSRWEIDKAELAKLDPHFQSPPAKDPDADSYDLADFVAKGYGRSYPLYHHLRVYGTTDTLSGMVARFAGFAEDSDETTYMRQLMRAWRDAHFSAYHRAERETEATYLARYDLDFRLRRLLDLRQHLDARINGGRDAQLIAIRKVIEEEMAHLRQLEAQLKSVLSLSDDQIAALSAALGAPFRQVMGATTLRDRYEGASRVYQSPEIKPQVDAAMSAIGAAWAGIFESSSKRIRETLTKGGQDELLTQFDQFHWHDVVTFPFLEGSGAVEHAEVQVFRVSPVDSSLNKSPRKLAGIAFGAFGGFLNRDWREHDILWGRLDGAERIATALLPEAEHEGLRRKFIADLQEAILIDEYGETRGQSRRMALLRARLADENVGDENLDQLAASALGVSNAAPMGRARFEQFYRDVKPTGPTAKDYANWGGRSAAILARMVDDLPENGALGMLRGRLSDGLRTGSTLGLRLTQFATVGSFRRLTIENLLFLIMIAGAVLALAGALSSSFSARSGILVMLVGLCLWTIIYATGRLLRGQMPFPAFLRKVAILVAIVLIGIGLWQVWSLLPPI